MEFPGQMWAFLSDGIGIVSGSMMGTTPLTGGWVVVRSCTARLVECNASKVDGGTRLATSGPSWAADDKPLSPALALQSTSSQRPALRTAGAPG